jgi:uncharacterized phage protein gp47/JayE
MPTTLTPLPEVFPRVYLETEDTVRARLLAGVPENWSSIEGAWARQMLEIDVPEFTRIWQELNRYLSYTFIRWAWGPLLDAHGVNYGTPRKEGTAAVGMVRFTAPEDTHIPPATLVGVAITDPDQARVTYQTSNLFSVEVGAAGFVDVPVISVENGSAGNQGPGAATLLESPNVEGVEGVSNPTAISGGSDPETDEAYRLRLEAQAALSLGSGAVLDYIVWSLEKPGIVDVAVEPLWDTSGTTPGVRDNRVNGSVFVSLRGPGFVGIDWPTVQEVQKYLDPSRQLLAQMEEGDPWTHTEGAGSISWSEANRQAGAQALVVTSIGAEADVAQVLRGMDLSRFSGSDEIMLWVKAGNWASLTNTTSVRLMSGETAYFEAKMTMVSGSGTTKPTSGSAWWLWRIQRNQFTEHEEPDWSAITALQIHQVTSAAATITWDYFTIQSEGGPAGGGRAPVGAAVTVGTPLPKVFDVAAKVIPEAGFSLSGAPGTANLSALLEAAISEWMQTLKPGEPLRISALEAVMKNVAGVADLVLLSPGATSSVIESGSGFIVLVPESGDPFATSGTVYVGGKEVTYAGRTGEVLEGVSSIVGIEVGEPVRQVDLPIKVTQYPVLGQLTLS